MRPAVLPFTFSSGAEVMTPKGAAMVIESLSLRVFEIEEAEARFAKEKAQHQARIKELELIRDGHSTAVVVTPIVSVE